MNTPPLPKISIITPSFNQGEYLEETILSVLDQQYPNLEYIVIDGGSSDLSSMIIDRYRDRLSHVRIGPDAGQYHAIQEGIEASSGDVIAWLNSDDKYHVGAFSRMAEASARFPESLWFCGLPTVWSRFGPLRMIYGSPPEWSHGYLRGLLNDPSPHYLQQESCFFRRALWDAAGASFDLSLKLAADYELWLRFSRIQQVTQLRSLIGGFRIHPKQRSQVHLTGYIDEVRRTIAEDDLKGPSPAPASASASASAKRAVPYLKPLREFVLATSIAPNRQFAQHAAVKSWVKAGFRVLSFNEADEIALLSVNFPDVEFVAVERTARPIVGKPLVYIRDVLDHLAGLKLDCCGIINSDISFVSTLGMMDAFAFHLRTQDLIVSSRVEVEPSLKQVAPINDTVGRPTLKYGPVYLWGFDLFLMSSRSARQLSDAMGADSQFAFGVPWWDYVVPSLAMKLKLRTGIFNPPPIAHPTHPANYHWRLWQMYGHLYLSVLGLDEAPDFDRFETRHTDVHLGWIGQQFIQMLVRGSSKIDLGPLVQLPDVMQTSMGHAPLDDASMVDDLSDNTVSQLSLCNAYGGVPVLNLPRLLREETAMKEMRRRASELLQRHGIEHGD